MLRQQSRRVLEPGRRLQFALGIDDLGPPLPLGFGLLGHGPLHLLRKIDVLHLHGRHVDTPGVRSLVDHLLQDRIELLPLGQQLIQLRLSDHRAKVVWASCDVANRKSSISSTARIGSLTLK